MENSTLFAIKDMSLTHRLLQNWNSRYRIAFERVLTQKININYKVSLAKSKLNFEAFALRNCENKSLLLPNWKYIKTNLLKIFNLAYKF